MFRRVVARLAVAVFAGALLVACGSEPEPQPDPGHQCGWMKKPDKDTSGAVAVLLDASNSTRSADAGKAPDYAGAVRDRLREAVKAGQTVSIGSFSGNATTVRWAERRLRTDSGASIENKASAEANALKCLENFVTQASADEPLVPGSDVLGAATAGFEELRDQQGELRLILATDGLSTTGCASLEKAAVGRMDVLENIVSLCTSRSAQTGTAPNGLKLTMVGIGHPSIGSPTPSTGQLLWLGQLWQRLCAVMNVQKENCAIETGSVMGKPAQRLPAPDMADPEIGFPKPEDGVDGEKEIVWAIGDSDLVLFEFDTPHLMREGIAQIERIAEKIKQYPGATTMITGHTDHRGTNAYNMDLSQRRAEAVRTVLRNNGVTAVETRWFGEEKPLCPGADEPAMKCNRRVEIVTNKGW